MFGECHAHIAMDGVNYAQAMKRHEKGPDEAHIRACLGAYRDLGITFVRDGGDGHDHDRDGHTSMSLGEGRGTVHTVTTFRDEEDDFFGPQRATLLILPDDPASGEPEIVPVPEKEDCP